MKTNDGGPAFPCVHPDVSGFPRGMTLRDYFAAKALQGITAEATVFCDYVAPLAYQYADAMLAERAA